MRQYNHSAQEIHLTFKDLVESYKASAAYAALGDGSKREYKKPIERLLEMGAELSLDMPKHVAVARSRSHVDFWYAKIVASEVSDYEKGRLILFVKMLYRHMGMGNSIEGLKLPVGMRHQRGDANPLTPAHVAQILDVEDPALRTYAVFVAFCFYTGLRPSEVFNLKWEDVGTEYIVVMGSKHKQKGVPTRMIPVLPEIGRCLNYCKTLGSAWVFVSALRRPLNKDVTCQKVKQIYGLCGIEAVLYDSRRGVATEMFRQGYDMMKIRDFLGHKSVRTTEGYIRMKMEEKADNYKGVLVGLTTDTPKAPNP